MSEQKSEFRIEVDEQTAALVEWLGNPIDGSMPSKAPNWGNPAYVADRAEIEAWIADFRVAPCDQPRLILTWLASYYGKSLETVLANLVANYNGWGAAWTAYFYRFGKHHKFNWLPKTKRVRLSVAIHPKLKRVIRLPPELVDVMGMWRWQRKIPELEPFFGVESIRKHEEVPEGLSLEEEVAWLQARYGS